MNKNWVKLQSSDEIRERLRALEDAGLSDDIHEEADIRYAEGYSDAFDGIIIEAEVERFNLYFENSCWEDERSDAYWSADADRHAERMFRVG